MCSSIQIQQCTLVARVIDINVNVGRIALHTCAHMDGDNGCAKRHLPAAIELMSIPLVMHV
eukprot:9858615-Alexandrium_andersonii.AAC.1